MKVDYNKLTQILTKHISETKLLNAILTEIEAITEQQSQELNPGDKVQAKLKNVTISGTVVIPKPLVIADIKIEGDQTLDMEFTGKTATASSVLKRFAVLNNKKNYYNSFTFKKIN